MSTRERQTGARGAFTLIELLVVVAVIAMLIGLLLPAVSSAREIGRDAVCLSGLRQMAIAATAYTNDHGTYPLAYASEFATDGAVLWAWDFTTRTAFGGGTAVEPGVLWPMEHGTGGGVRIQQCPSYDGAHNWVDDPFTGYNYNTSYIGRDPGVHPEHPSMRVRPARPAEVSLPSLTAIFGDGGYAGGANKFMRAPWPGPWDIGFSGRSAGTQAYRHRGATHISWCDGSVKAMHERWTETAAHEQAAIAENTGFLGPNNDLYDLD